MSQKRVTEPDALGTEPNWWRRLPAAGSLALLAYMPFHIFLSQWLSTFTGGLSGWKIGKDVLTAVLLAVTLVLLWRAHRSTRLFRIVLGLAVVYFVLHVTLWAAHPHIYRTSALLGIVYNNRLFAWLLLGMGARLLWPNFSNRTAVRVVLGASTLVAIFGIVEYFLPSDALTHVGYSVARGVRPVFEIDNKPGLIRVMSTLRDPNSLGAYLMVPIALLVSEWLRTKGTRRRLLLGSLIAVHALALFWTFSRSAWLGTLVALLFVVWWQYRARLVPMVRRWWPMLAGLLLLASAGIFAERHTHFVKTYVIHSVGKPQAQYDSDGFHWLYAKRGLEGIWRNPLGHGPGTAGLASIQNPKGGMLTENYYIQVGYEVGVAGLALFVALNVLVYRALRRRGGQLGGVLMAAFWGYVITNMLLHMWSNEAVAAQWWLLAGLAIGQMAGDAGSASARPSK